MLIDDVVDAVIGLGPNLFYNSPMESCLLVCRWNKPKSRKGKVLFINAVKEVSRQSAFSFLDENHIEKIHQAFKDFKDASGFAKVVDNKDIISNKSNLSISLYVSAVSNGNGEKKLHEVVDSWVKSSSELKKSTESLLTALSKKI